MRGAPTPRKRARAIVSRLILGAILLLGLGLRFFRIGHQSYWNDEGNSLALAGSSAADILRAAAADIHPPGYYLALSVWRALAGDSELALRAFSALAGVVLLALLYRLGREYFSRPAGLATAALGALHPFLIYYSQEARMYSLLATLSAASFLLFSRWLRSSRPPAPPLGNWRLGLGFSLVTAAGLYTHYAFGFVVLAQSLAALGGLLAHRSRHGSPRPRLVAWFGWQGLAVLLYLPWLPTAVRQLTQWPAERSQQPFGSAVVDLGRTLAFGRTGGEDTSALFVAGAAVLVLFGLRARGQSITPLLWLLVPAGLTLGLGLLNESFAKLLLTAVPAFCILAGAGLVQGARAALPGPGRNGLVGAVWAMCLAALVLGGGPALQNLYFNPAYQRDDYRGIAQYLAAVQRPGDAVITISPNQVQAFGYYHTSGAPVYPLPMTRPLDPAATAGALEAIAADHARIFVLFWGERQADPDGFVENWLNTRAFKAGDAWYGQVRLATYAAAAPATGIAYPTQARFGEHIWLEGYSLPSPELAAGDILQVTLFWRTDSRLPERYKVFVHLYADEAQSPLAQQDGEPGGGLTPTDGWLASQRYADNHGVLLPADLPPGRSSVMIGLYNLFNDVRLPVIMGDVEAGDRLALTDIVVTAP